jgi:hypothetical protein
MIARGKLCSVGQLASAWVIPPSQSQGRSLLGAVAATGAAAGHLTFLQELCSPDLFPELSRIDASDFWQLHLRHRVTINN